MKRLLLASAALGALACAALRGPASQEARPAERAGAANGDASAAAPEPDALKHPPPPGLERPLSFPSVQQKTLSNGLGVSYIRREGVPLTRLVLSFASGRAQEGSRAGVARVAARLMKLGGAAGLSGGQMVDRFEALGARVKVSTSADATTLRLTVLNGDVPGALALLGKLLQSPGLSPAEFARLKQLEIERAEAKARGDLEWGNHMVVYRELFDLPTGAHPYAHFDATRTDLERLQLSDCTQWIKERLVPENAELSVVGSLDPDELFSTAEQTLAGWSGKKPGDIVWNRPTGPERLRIFVVDHEDVMLSVITAGLMGAPRKSAAWPALSVAVELLGGGSASRLYVDLVEKRSLALRARADLEPLVAAPAVVILAATTLNEKATSVVQKLIRHVERFGKTAPEANEVESAARALAAGFLNDPDPMRALSAQVQALARFELEPHYYDGFYQSILDLDAKTVHQTTAPYFDKERMVIVVSGPAKLLAEPLAALAPVAVVDAEKGFAIKKTLPYSPLGGG